MNYDRVILELLDRVSKLEEEVNILKKGGAQPQVTANNTLGVYGVKPESHTDRACAIIENAIAKAKEEGKDSIVVVSNDLQHAVGIKNRIPLCCNAMRKVAEKYRSEVVADTPSHNSSTYAIKYWID